MAIFNTLTRFFVKFYFLFLILIVLISYGQILNMYVWQDDNALMFKLAHIEEKAGYLGPGPFGIGAYKYTITPYIPIYKIFGYNTVPYFVFTLFLYVVSTLVVYKVFSMILGIGAGRLAGFLYGAGYIASDGFIRLFNSPITSLSVILISLLTLSFWKLYHSLKDSKSYLFIKWYLISLTTFFLATELAIARTHYLLGVVIAFEVLFMAFHISKSASLSVSIYKNIKSILFSILRLIPFGYIFYQYFILNSDHRSGQIPTFIKALIDGQYYQTYSFITSITKVVFPDWLSASFIDVDFIIRFAFLLFALIIMISFYKKRYKILLITSFLSIALVWTKFYKFFYNSPVLDLGVHQFFYVFIGGLMIIYFFVGLLLNNQKRLYLFFLAWFILNITAYSAYNPTVLYESINRYFAHSFYALIGLICVVYAYAFKSRISRNIFLVIIVLWGFGNLGAAVFYQRDIVLNRSNPPKAFYNQLHQIVPSIKKGDVFYFDVADNASGDFNEAFSVAQMPEATAIAWRYGVDRYDLQLFTSFKDLISYLGKNKVEVSKVHSFFYAKRQLFDTSSKFNQAITPESSGSAIIDFNQTSDSTIQFGKSVNSVWPMEFSISLQAEKIDGSKLTFPLGQGTNVNEISKDPRKALLALDYQRSKKAILKKTYTASSQWRDRVSNNLHDGDLGTVWQTDRVIWSSSKGDFTIGLGEDLEIDKFVWVNGYATNTPTEYRIEVSNDGIGWRLVKEVTSNARVDNKDPQIVTFIPVKVRFVKMVILKTLNNDAPAIAESWVVPTKYKDIVLSEAEQFFKNPLQNSQNITDLQDRLAVLNNQLEVSVYWKNNKNSYYLNSASKNINITLSDSPQIVKILIPAGGTNLESLKLDNKNLPMKLKVIKLDLRYPGMTEVFESAL